jgi:hypothetical protein
MLETLGVSSVAEATYLAMLQHPDEELNALV